MRTCVKCGGDASIRASRGMCPRCYFAAYYRGEIDVRNRQLREPKPNADGSFNNLFPIDGDQWHLGLLSPMAAKNYAEWVESEKTQ